MRGTAVICFSQHARSASYSGMVTHQVLRTETKFVSGKQPQQNTKGWRKKATGTNTVHLQTNDPACTPVWHTVWNFWVTYHKSYLTAEHLTSHLTILCNHKTYAQEGYTSVMLKGCTDEIIAAVLSDQTREWLYHPHYNSSDLTPAPDIHKFSHIQLSYLALCKRKRVTKHRPPEFSWTLLI